MYSRNGLSLLVQMVVFIVRDDDLGGLTVIAKAVRDSVYVCVSFCVCLCARAQDRFIKRKVVCLFSWKIYYNNKMDVFEWKLFTQ